MRMMILAVSMGVAVVGLSSCSQVELPGRPPKTARGLPHQPLPPMQFDWPQDKQVGVSLSFDDARTSQVDVGAPLLSSYGVKATFYVSVAPLRERLADWKAVLAAGHEIGNHSLRHACTGNFPFAREKALEDCTLEQMAAELDRANAEIEGLLGVRPVTFAYPCGQKFVGRGVEVKSYVPVVASRFLAGRGWRDEMANNPAFCDLAQLLGLDLDGLTWEQLKALIDQARERHGWLVLGGHEIGQGGRQTTRMDTLRSFCEYAQDPKNGVWVDTVANISRYIAEHRVALGRDRAGSLAVARR
ncbi:MAG: polysaccharide deacetylase family protein [Phycisphaerae bacterium]|nr:polysaccharide deacetylase family protein [Phycisphaerae bacterium]